MEKMKQTNVRKHPVEWSKINGERLFIDVCSSSAKSLGNKCHWLLVIDDCSDNVRSYFL